MVNSRHGGLDRFPEGYFNDDFVRLGQYLVAEQDKVEAHLLTIRTLA